MSEPFNQLSLTRCSDAYWRITFNHPPINLLDDNTVPELEHLLDLAEAELKLKVIVFDSANPDFFIAHFSPAAGFRSSSPRITRRRHRKIRIHVHVARRPDDSLSGKPTNLTQWRIMRLGCTYSSARSNLKY
jgi:hypothetical protein